MSDANRMARRYHWLSEHVASFVDEPHEAVCCDARGETLNLVAHENDAVRRGSAELASADAGRDAEALERSGRMAGGGRARMLTMPAGTTLLPELDVGPPHLRKDSGEDLRARA